MEMLKWEVKNIKLPVKLCCLATVVDAVVAVMKCVSEVIMVTLNAI